MHGSKDDQLDIKTALKVLSPESTLAYTLKDFEPREEQKQMMENVLEAYNSSQIALIEAGTGTGKSLAYLIPAMLWAAQTKERSVISTNTITLQEQLLNKDIPLINSALNLNINAVLVKGMHNYLCLRKFYETQQETVWLSPQENHEFEKIDQWKENTKDGSRSSLSFSHSTVWEKVAAESDSCNRMSCPYYQECFFFKARRQASEAQILIVNHHLLFADIVYRIENNDSKDTGILPTYTRLILDEAHHIEDVATEYFASRVSLMDIIRLMARLTSEKGGKMDGKLTQLREKIIGYFRNNLSKDINSIINRLTIDFTGMRRDLLQQVHDVFGFFSEFVQLMQPSEKGSRDEEKGDSNQSETKLRILPHHPQHRYWQQQLLPMGKQLVETLKKYTQVLSSLEKDLKLLNNPQLEEQTKGILFEIAALGMRLNNYALILERFISGLPPSSKVRWIERQQLKTIINTSLIDAELDISTLLAEYLFSKFSTVILCSATLTTNKHFDFIRSRLGLNLEQLKQRVIKECIFESPFNFEQQALLAIPTDLPPPTDLRFVYEASEKIWQILQSSRGNAFILFTSYTMLKMSFELLELRLKEHRFNPLKQGLEERQLLLDKFKSIDRSVLFGTDSFWEGVDVVGEALRCVIIVKLPFKVPSDPLVQARTEAITEKGGDPFMEYSLPQAIVKFKQGFGRLIRNRRDRGCIVCLDNRLMTKKYGKSFLDSLPECEHAFVTGNLLQKKMTEFYRKTQFLINNS